MNFFAQAPRPRPGIEEIIKAVVFLIIIFSAFVVPIIRQFWAKIKGFPPPEKRPLAPRPAPPDVADEIEEFMRRKTQRRQANREWADSPKTAAAPVKAEVIVEPASDAGKPVGGQVTKHVQSFLDERKFERRESELGKEVAQADEQIDQHLQQVFTHRVSKLETVPGEAAKAPVAYEPPNLVGNAEDIPPSFATGLLDLLTTPDSLRQAVVLNEILHRPEERWR